MGRSLSISLLPRVTWFGQPMHTFRRLGALSPISLNDGLSFNNNNNNNNNKGEVKKFHVNIESKILSRLWKIPPREQPRTYVHGRRKLLKATPNAQPEVVHILVKSEFG